MEKQLTLPRLREEMSSGVLCARQKEDGEALEAGEPL